MLVIQTKRFNTAIECYKRKSLSSFELSSVIGEVITDMNIELCDTHGFHLSGQSSLKHFLREEIKPIYHLLSETAIINRIYERCEELGFYNTNKPKEIIALMTATIS